MTANPTVIPAIIALFGIIFSVTVSSVVTYLSTRSEIRKLKTDLRNQYASKLLERRLEAYVQGYYILSHFVKVGRGFIGSGTCLTPNDVEIFNEKISEWDSNTAIILSSMSVELMYKLREQLRDINKIKVNIEVWNASISEILDQAELLEISLRNDVGIFDVEMHEERKFVKSGAEFLKKLGSQVPS